MTRFYLRGGNQVVFSSINYGTDTSAEGRCIIRELLKSTYQGVGNGETAIFPIQIETNRGHNLGRIIYEGKAAENTGIPGIIQGYGKERVIYASAEGILKTVHDIGDVVQKNEIIAYIGTEPVKASLTGLIRGMIRGGSFVKKGLKISDIDPREDQLENCYTISDKARTVSGGAAEAVFFLLNKNNKSKNEINKEMINRRKIRGKVFNER